MLSTKFEARNPHHSWLGNTYRRDTSGFRLRLLRPHPCRAIYRRLCTCISHPPSRCELTRGYGRCTSRRSMDCAERPIGSSEVRRSSESGRHRPAVGTLGIRRRRSFLIGCVWIPFDQTTSTARALFGFIAPREPLIIDVVTVCQEAGPLPCLGELRSQCHRSVPWSAGRRLRLKCR